MPAKGFDVRPDEVYLVRWYSAVDGRPLYSGTVNDSKPFYDRRRAEERVRGFAPEVRAELLVGKIDWTVDA